MYKFLIVSLCILVVGCNSNNAQEQGLIASAVAPIPVPDDMIVYGPVINPDPYDMILKLKETEKDVFNFEVSMYLFNGAHYISPNAKRDFKGKFTVHFNESEAIKIVDTLEEIPQSVEEIDLHPFTDDTVNWVRENTKYHQKIKRTTDENFEVKGFIQFTIEPRCTLEKIPFVIKNEAGEISVEEFGC